MNNKFEYRAFLLSKGLPYQDLPIAGGRKVWCIPFPRVLELHEMQTAMSRIWTQVTVSISDYDNHYTTSASLIYIILVMNMYPLMYNLIFYQKLGVFDF